MSITYKARLMFLPTQNNPVDVCGCHYCDTEWQNVMDDLDPDSFRSGAYMILCETCGNKRCPKATYHGHDCTGSNEPGQSLSVYGGFRLPNDRGPEVEPVNATGAWEQWQARKAAK